MANFETFDALLNETLGALEEKGAEEKKNKNNKNKNKNNNKGKGKSPSSSDKVKEPSSSEKTEYNLDLPKLKLEPDDYEIKPEEHEPEITNPVTFEETHKKIGEEVTEEYVEKLMEDSSMPEGGHKATVIIHTRTIIEEAASDEPKDDFEVPAKDEPDEEDAEAELLRQIKESEQEADRHAAQKKTKVSLIRKDTGEVYEIGPMTTIGREEGDIVIGEPDGKYLSDNHATFRVDDKGKVFLKEREGGTTNGTKVNGTRVSSRYLKDGDLIWLGGMEFVISIE